MKRENGITLIALVITIIVMLILVLVTISFVVNGNLFKNAEEGSVGTERNLIYETILSSYEFSKDGVLNMTNTLTNAEDALKSMGYKDDEIIITCEGGNFQSGSSGKTTVASRGQNEGGILIASNTNTNPSWAVICVIAKTGTYYYEITIKPTTAFLSEEKDSDDNIILTGGENEYTVDDNGSVTIGSSSDKWYLLTAEEIATLEALSAETGEQLIMTMPFGEGEDDIAYYYQVGQLDSGLNVGVMVYKNSAQIYAGQSNITFGYAVGDDWAQVYPPEEMEYVTLNVWGVDGVVYEGACPPGFYLSNDDLDGTNDELYLPSYVDRMNDHFTGTKEPYDITEEEHFQVCDNGGYNNGTYIIAAKRSGTTFDIYSSDPNEDYIMAYPGRGYLPIDEIAIQYNGNHYAYSVSENKWYQTTLSPYNTTEISKPAIDFSSYTVIYSTSYFNRIVSNFAAQ